MQLMRNKAIMAALLSTAVFSTGCGSFDSPGPSSRQDHSGLEDFQDFTLTQRLEDFNWITAIFEENYAMLDYKQTRYGFDWNELKQQYLEKISADGVTRELFSALMQEFVATMRDAHTSARPLRNAIADGSVIKVTSLGFLTERETGDGTDRARVTKIYKRFFPDDNHAPVKEGDYLISIDGRDIAEIIQNDIIRYRDLGQPDSNLTMGMAALVNRANISHALLPSGHATIKLLRNQKIIEVKLPWVTAGIEELRTDPAVTDTNAKFYPQKILDINPDGSYVVQMSSSGIMRPSDLPSQAFAPRARSVSVQDDVALYNYLGASAPSSIPTNAVDLTVEGMDFKLLSTEKGLAAVYRVEDFMWSRFKCQQPVDVGNGLKISVCRGIMGEDYAKAFSKLKAFGAKSLVIDLRGNGGGALDLGYELLRAFSVTGINANLASLRLNEEWVGDFKYMSQASWLPLTTRQGYQQQYQILQQDIAAQKRMSTPVAITGLTTLFGTADAWTGPTYLLTDELCASMCDIFATQMQDHGLGKVIGKQSMGAGGNVIGFQWTPHTKIQLTQTASVMLRPDGKVIENEGVKPDVATTTTSGHSFWETVKSTIDAHY